jgi:hypothetical protein
MIEENNKSNTCTITDTTDSSALPNFFPRTPTQKGTKIVIPQAIEIQVTIRLQFSSPSKQFF